MKPNYNQPAVWLLKIIAIGFTLAAIFTSCATPNLAVEKYAKSLEIECNLELDYNDRIIIGYEQDIFNRNYYKVLDGEYFKPAQRVREDSILKPIGTILTCKY